MNTKSRITSIQKANTLDASVTGIPSFSLSELHLKTDLEFEIPTNLRLGHLAEKVVSELIKASTNYNVLYENIQLIENKKTIGEIDFIITNKETAQLIHLELAYKFYLYDPKISNNPINNWTGPNRKDSLTEKLEKLKSKQFPLLYLDAVKTMLGNLNIQSISQKLCLLPSLFIPYEYNENLNPVYKKSIKGYYIDFEKFINANHTNKKYYIPTKTAWGIDPSENKTWNDFESIKAYITICIQERQAPLCWQKKGDSYQSFFVVWW